MIRTIRAEQIVEFVEKHTRYLVTFSGQTTQGVRYWNPFGREFDELTRLREWLRNNCEDYSYYLVIRGVKFKNEADAILCYMAWK